MFFDYCGSKVYFEDLQCENNQEAEALVFLHGWGSESGVFAPICEVMKHKYRCLLVDFLGFGKSHQPPVGMTVQMQGEMILALCNFCGVKNFHIMSHSYGGRVAFFLLCAKNTRVKTAVLIAPAGVKERNFAKSLKVKLFKIRKKLTPKSKIKSLEKFYSADYLASFGVMRETFNHAINCDQTSQLSEIKQKILIVRGKNDSAITAKMVKTMKKRIRNSEVEIINGDHFAFLQSRLEFELLARKFFEV